MTYEDVLKKLIILYKQRKQIDTDIETILGQVDTSLSQQALQELEETKKRIKELEKPKKK